MAPHSSTLAWRIPWMEEPGGLQSMGWQTVRQGWATSLSLSCLGEGNGNPLQCLAWRIPGMGEPGGLPSRGSHSRTRLKWLSSSIYPQVRVISHNPFTFPSWNCYCFMFSRIQPRPINKFLKCTHCSSVWHRMTFPHCFFLVDTTVFTGVWSIFMFLKQTHMEKINIQVDIKHLSKQNGIQLSWKAHYFKEDFSGGPADKNQPASAEDTVSIRGPERSTYHRAAKHMHRTAEPTSGSYWRLEHSSVLRARGVTAMSSLSTTTKRNKPRSLQLEEAQKSWPSTAKNRFLKTVHFTNFMHKFNAILTPFK